MACDSQWESTAQRVDYLWLSEESRPLPRVGLMVSGPFSYGIFGSLGLFGSIFCHFTWQHFQENGLQIWIKSHWSSLWIRSNEYKTCAAWFKVTLENQHSHGKSTILMVFCRKYKEFPWLCLFAGRVFIIWDMMSIQFPFTSTCPRN